MATKHTTVRELQELLANCSPDELVLIDNPGRDSCEYPYAACTAAYIVVRKLGDEVFADNGDNECETQEEQAAFDAENGTPIGAVHIYPAVD